MSVSSTLARSTKSSVRPPRGGPLRVERRATAALACTVRDLRGTPGTPGDALATALHAELAYRTSCAVRLAEHAPVMRPRDWICFDVLALLCSLRGEPGYSPNGSRRLFDYPCASCGYDRHSGVLWWLQLGHGDRAGQTMAALRSLRLHGAAGALQRSLSDMERLGPASLSLQEWSVEPCWYLSPALMHALDDGFDLLSCYEARIEQRILAYARTHAIGGTTA
jgi:hypothetical protein